MAEAGGLPSGIVTFVFTDIESSTRLMRRLGDDYPEASERHVAVMRSSWDTHHGHEISSSGDSVFVAFQDPADAVRACADAQRRLNDETWPNGAELKVRMGIHTGMAAARANNYTALAVNQASRVMSAAHGGQVLVSDETARLLESPADLDLVALGRYRVRDFDEPLQLFTLADGATPRIAEVRAVPADGHNLVAPATRLIGRDTEIGTVTEDLASGIVVCLVGPGGVGKTRLATEVGRRVAPDWPDGVWMVDLAPVQDSTLIGAAVRTAVGTPTQSGDAWQDVLDDLGPRRALVIIDNCELLLTDVSRMIDQLLSACPGCAVMATSREPLGIARERTYRVPPLDADAAVALFADRALAAGRTVTVDHTVTEICRRLDGLPLAIELAAARIGVLQPVDVLQGLDDRFRLLRRHSSDVPERHQTLEALLEWDERLLTADEQVCLRRLAVFGGSFTLAAAVAAVSFDDVDAYDVPELVWSLAEKSLVVTDPAANETRFRLLESVRAFAARRLDASEQARAADAVAAWYLDLLGPTRRFAPGWFGEVAANLDNLRGLITPVAASSPDRAQQLAYVIGRYFDRGQSFRAGIEEISRYLERLPQATKTRISLLTILGDLQLRLGNVEAAQRAVSDAEALRAEVGDPPEWDDVAIERTRGEIASRSGDNDAAIASAQRALTGDLSVRGQARMWSQLGIAAHEQGAFDLALDAFQREYDAYRDMNDEILEAQAAGNLAEIHMVLGHHSEAARFQRICLGRALEIGAPVMVAFSMIVAARLAEARREWQTAATLHGHADVLLETTGFALYDADRRLSDEMLKRVEEQLGSKVFAAAVASGRSLDLAEAVALADRVLGEATSQ